MLRGAWCVVRDRRPVEASPTVTHHAQRTTHHASRTTHHAPRITHPLIFRAHAPINWPTSGVQTCSAGWNLSHGLRKCLPDSARVRPDHAAGRVVGATVAHVPRALGLHYLRDLGGVSRRVLSLGT